MESRYKPTTNVRDAVRRAFPVELFPWDDYYPRMAESDFLLGRGDVSAAKAFFIRKAPFNGSYAVLAGITGVLEQLASVDFTDPDFQAGMLDMNYHPRFVEWLASRRHLRVELHAPAEGSVFFPNEPIVPFRGPLADLRLVEGILLKGLNFPTLSMTKWNRLVRTVRPGTVFDFSRRRAQHDLKAAFYGALSGCFATANSELRRFLLVLIIGTMGHEWIQSFGQVRRAFDAWLEVNPHKPVGLVDTKQCMSEDFPAWLDSVYAHREAIKAANPLLWGWRNDSGDLAYLTVEQYRTFFRHPLAQNPWFVERMRIFLTNDLDEYSARSIIEQIRTAAGQAGLPAEDIIRRIVWAAGTKPGSCDDQPSLGGVAKLMEVDGHDCIKLAFDADGRPGVKTSIPGDNRSAIIRDSNGEPINVLIYPHDRYRVNEHGQLCNESGPMDTIVACHLDNAGARLEIKNYQAVPQQQLVYDSVGRSHEQADLTLGHTDTIEMVQKRVQLSVDSLPWWMTRMDKPHTMKVSVTPDLFELRRNMIEQGVLRADYLE